MRPNVNFIRNTKTGTITFRTVRPVEAGEELCVCYSADESKLWFVDTALPNGTSDPDRPIESDSAHQRHLYDFPSILPTDLIDSSEHVEREIKREQRMKRIEAELELRTLKEARLAEHARRRANGRDGSPGSSGSGSTDDDSLEIKSPRPVPFTHPIVSVPKLSHDIPTALPAETLESLPPPLHSTTTPSPNTPPDIGAASLVSDLEWSEDDWIKVKDDDERIAGLGEVERIKGHAEIDEEDDYNGTSDSTPKHGGRLVANTAQWRSGLSMWRNPGRLDWY